MDPSIPHLILPTPCFIVRVCVQKSETPDKKSKALQQLAQDFGDACRAIAKSVGKKGGSADASKAYDKATSILTDYLTGTELDPIGSDVYK